MKRPSSPVAAGRSIDAARLEDVLTEALFLYGDTADLAAIARQRDDQAGRGSPAERCGSSACATSSSATRQTG